LSVLMDTVQLTPPSIKPYRTDAARNDRHRQAGANFIHLRRNGDP
jgi:hypothetical protein